MLTPGAARRTPSQISKTMNLVKGLFTGFNPAERIAFVKCLDGDEACFKEIKYDCLVICTGSSYVDPIKPSTLSYSIHDRLEELCSFKEKLLRSRKVMVVGGGLVGVELAAELAVRNHELVESGNHREVILLSKSVLLGALPNLAGDYALSWLKKNGVSVLLDDEVASLSTVVDKKYVETSKGVRINDVDVLVDCTNGAAKNLESAQYKNMSEFISGYTTKVYENSVVWPYNQYGLVVVNDNLQSAYPGVFAAGDCVDFSGCVAGGVGFACDSIATGKFCKSCVFSYPFPF